MSILNSPIQFFYPKNQLLAKLEAVFIYWGGCSIINHLYPERVANQKYDLWEYIMSHIGLLASQGRDLPLAGPLSLIFSSTKVTASEESKTYANLSSPESGSAKYSQRRSSMQELRTDNLLNIKVESAFVQAVGKEKGPAVSQALLSTLIISSPRNSQGLEHNLPLQAIGNLFYSRHQHPNKTGAGFSIPNFQADIRRYKRFFFVRNKQRCAPIMVGRSGGALALAGFLDTGMLTLLRLATPFSIGERGSIELIQEAAAMVATTQTRPEFIDTYWIIPEYTTTPYGKVSFTHQDRCIFIALFKDSRLVWAGRQPVGSTTYGKHTRSHEGIEEISIPQGMVKITPPLTITNIVTVPATVSDIATVQGVAHV